MSTWLWYLFLAANGLAILESFRALVEEWVLHTHAAAEEPVVAEEAKQKAPEGLTMQQVRAQRSAYRRALAGGLGASGSGSPGAIASGAPQQSASTDADTSANPA